MLERQSVSSTLRKAEEAFVDRVYTGRIETVCRLTGLDRALTPLEVPDKEITVRDVTCRFRVDSVRELVWWESYFESPARFGGEMPVLEAIVRTLRPDDTFWDVGANVGIYACHASKRIDSGSVVAVEPNPRNAERIRTNLRCNGTDGTVYQLAFAASADELELQVSDVPGSYGSTHSLPWVRWNSVNAITVDGVPGDAFRRRDGVPDPDVLKIDVEGAEYDVLCGLEETLSSPDGPRAVYCNVHSAADNGIADTEVRELLCEYGYEVERMWEWPTSDGHFVRGEK